MHSRRFSSLPDQVSRIGSGSVRNGKKYTPVAAMPGLKHATEITDAHLADVATFVRHAWNNRKGAVDAATVSKARKRFKERNSAFTPEELKKIYP